MTGGRKILLTLAALGLVAAASTPAVAADSQGLGAPACDERRRRFEHSGIDVAASKDQVGFRH